MKRIGFQLFLMSLISLINPANSAIHAQTNCEILDWHEYEQSSEAGEVVFVADNRLQFTHYTPEALKDVTIYHLNLIKTNGEWLVWYEFISEDDEIDSASLNFYNYESGYLDSLEFYTHDYHYPYRIEWIKQNRLLSIYIAPLRIPYYYPIHIVNLQTQEVTYVYPYVSDISRVYEELLGHPTTGLYNAYGDDINNSWHFSPDGLYEIGNYYFTDLSGNEYYPKLRNMVTLEVMELQNLQRGVWSADSTQVIRFQENAIDNNYIDVFVYNLKDDIQKFVNSFKTGEFESFRIEANSWSTDKQYLAMYHSQEEGYEHLEFLNLENFEVRETCFGIYKDQDFQLSWSLDGRYLALYGVLESETDANTGTIYIYDTQTDIAYEVFTGDAEIIGWARIHDE